MKRNALWGVMVTIGLLWELCSLPFGLRPWAAVPGAVPEWSFGRLSLAGQEPSALKVTLRVFRSEAPGGENLYGVPP